MAQLLAIVLEILAAVVRALGILGTIVTLAQALYNLLQPSQGGSTWSQLSNEVGTSLSEIENPSYGLNALAALVATARSDILAAIANTQQAGSPVTLPTSPPPAYGGTLTAADVWQFPIGSQGYLAEDLMGAAGMVGLNTGNAAGLITAGAGPFRLENGIDDANNSVGTNGPPRVAYSTILPTDDRFSWLQREWPLTPFDWQYEAESDTYWYYDRPSEAALLWRCTLQEAEFLAIQNGGPSPVASLTAPVWPGLARVTLGSPVAISDGAAISGPMSGVIIAITAVPYPVGFYPFGSVKSYTRAGGIIFQDDNGDWEMAQGIGLEANVVCPKTMVQAEQAIIRVPNGITGTVTPFLIT